VNLPQGASLAATDRVVAQLEAAASEDPRVERNYSRVGSRLVAGGMSLNTTGEHLGQINLVLKNKSDDKVEEVAVERTAQEIRSHPGRRGEVRPAVVLQPENADRSRALRRGSRCAA
jgi:multidrug efflux pump subunit AcrB